MDYIPACSALPLLQFTHLKSTLFVVTVQLVFNRYDLISYEHHFVWVYLPATSSHYVIFPVKSSHLDFMFWIPCADIVGPRHAYVTVSYELWVMIIHFPGRNTRARIQRKARGAPNELHSSRELCHEKACSPGASCFFALPENYHGNGKSSFSTGNTSSNGGVSIVMLVFRGVFTWQKVIQPSIAPTEKVSKSHLLGIQETEIATS